MGGGILSPSYHQEYLFRKSIVSQFSTDEWCSLYPVYVLHDYGPRNQSGSYKISSSVWSCGRGRIWFVCPSAHRFRNVFCTISRHGIPGILDDHENSVCKQSQKTRIYYAGPRLS